MPLDGGALVAPYSLAGHRPAYATGAGYLRVKIHAENIVLFDLDQDAFWFTFD